MREEKKTGHGQQHGQIGQHGQGSGPSKQGHHGGPRRHQLDENSWQWKWKFGQRPEHERIEVTIDTKVPELPKTLIKKPNRDEFEKGMKELDRDAEALKIDIEELRYKKRQVYETGHVGDESIEYKALMTEKFDEVKKFQEEKRKHYDRLKVLKEQAQAIEAEK